VAAYGCAIRRRQSTPNGFAKSLEGSKSQRRHDMTTIQRAALSMLIASLALNATSGSPAFARAHAHVSEHAMAAHAQAFPNGSAPQYAPARTGPNSVYSPNGRYIGSDPSGYVRIEMFNDYVEHD
jgi:hypothetical protein